MKTNSNIFGCSFAICVTPDDKGIYEEGKIYPVCGANNGMQVVGIGGKEYGGDAEVLLCMCGGTGKGLFNPYDDSGRPSFNPISIKPVLNSKFLKIKR